MNAEWHGCQTKIGEAQGLALLKRGLEPQTERFCLSRSERRPILFVQHGQFRAKLLHGSDVYAFHGGRLCPNGSMNFIVADKTYDRLCEHKMGCVRNSLFLHRQYACPLSKQRLPPNKQQTRCDCKKQSHSLHGRTQAACDLDNLFLEKRGPAWLRTLDENGSTDCGHFRQFRAQPWGRRQQPRDKTRQRCRHIRSKDAKPVRDLCGLDFGRMCARQEFPTNHAERICIQRRSLFTFLNPLARVCKALAQFRGSIKRGSWATPWRGIQLRHCIGPRQGLTHTVRRNTRQPEIDQNDVWFTGFG